jgi:hypothetical protein
MRGRVRSWLAFVIIVIVGCGGIPRDEYVAAWIDADCDRAVRCGEVASKEVCVAWPGLSRARDTTLSDIQYAVASRRVDYDRGRAAACVDERRYAACDRTTADWRAAGACAEVFAGRVEMGGDCLADAECCSGACLRGHNTNACAFGTCVEPQPQIRVGEPCSFSRYCVDGAYCDGVGFVCAPLKPQGAACDSQEECAFGTYCENGTCVSTPGRGEACPEESCGNWLGDRCDPQSGTCVALGRVGGSCDYDSQCQVPLTCRDGTCAELPGVGQPCFDVFCALDAFCDAGVCVARRSEGEPCAWSGECLRSSCIKPSSGEPGVCGPPPPCPQP